MHIIRTFGEYTRRFGYKYIETIPPDVQIYDWFTGQILTDARQIFVYQQKLTSQAYVQALENPTERFYLLMNALREKQTISSAWDEYMQACANYEQRFISQRAFAQMGMTTIVLGWRFRSQHYPVTRKDEEAFLHGYGDFLRYYDSALPVNLSPGEFNTWLTDLFRKANYLPVIPPLFDYGVISIIRNNKRYYLVVPFKEKNYALDVMYYYFKDVKACPRYLTLVHAMCEAKWFFIFEEKKRLSKKQNHDKRLNTGEGTGFMNGKRTQFHDQRH